MLSEVDSVDESVESSLELWLAVGDISDIISEKPGG